MNTFFKDYINKLKILLDDIDVEVLQNIASSLIQSSKDNSIVYIIGNGGSLATASHIANDWGIGLRGVIDINIISLGDNTVTTSAIANDSGFENIFSMQLHNKLSPKDVVIAISCSGNSHNIIKASKYAKEIGATLIGVSGFDGGELKNISDISFHINTSNGEYGLVEDIHIILNHIMYSYFMAKNNG